MPMSCVVSRWQAGSHALIIVKTGLKQKLVVLHISFTRCR